MHQGLRVWPTQATTLRLTFVCHLTDVDVLLLGHEAQHGKDGNATVQTGEAVDADNDQGVSVGRVVRKLQINNLIW